MAITPYEPVAIDLAAGDDVFLDLYAPKDSSAEASSSRIPSSFLKATTRSAQATLQRSKRRVEEQKALLEEKDLELQSLLKQRQALAKASASDSMDVDEDGVLAIPVEIPEDLPSEEHFEGSATEAQRAGLPPRDDPEYAAALLVARLELEMEEINQREAKVKELNALVKSQTRENEQFKKRSILADMALEDLQKQMARARKLLEEVVVEESKEKEKS